MSGEEVVKDELELALPKYISWYHKLTNFVSNVSLVAMIVTLFVPNPFMLVIIITYIHFYNSSKYQELVLAAHILKLRTDILKTELDAK